MFSSDVVNPQAALCLASTVPLPPTLTQQITVAQEAKELLDLRIGLKLLGQEGRLLLVQYLRAKSQQAIPL